MNKVLMIIDGNSLLHRAFYALPVLTNKKGVFTNAVYGFLNMLLKLISDYKPDSLAVAFDKKAPTFRHREYKAYKGTRQKAPEELVPQFELAREAMKQMNIPIYEMDGYEADDILGTLSRSCGGPERDVLLVTGDKDALQLVSGNSNVLLTKKGITVLHRYNEKEMKKEYGLTPLQFIDMKGLMGDKSDNIPGVPGIGPKTATRLLQQYGTLENVLDHTDEMKGKLKENLTIYRQHALLSKDLATIRLDVPIDCSVMDQPLSIPKSPELKDFLQELGFSSIIEKLGLTEVETAVQEEAVQETNTYSDICHEEEVRALLPELMKQKLIAVTLDGELQVSWEPGHNYRLLWKGNKPDSDLSYQKTLQAR